MAASKINQDHQIETANRMIERWGQTAILRRASGDRTCIVAVSTFSPMERMGQMLNPVDRKAIVSAKGLDIPPDQEQDRLVVGDEVLRIIEPPKQNGTADKVIYYSMAVRA